jgi:hypothetical protein
MKADRIVKLPPKKRNHPSITPVSIPTIVGCRPRIAFNSLALLCRNDIFQCESTTTTITIRDTAMEQEQQAAQRHPANAVFALMDDREFRYSVIRPALQKDKAGVCRLTTGKHQLKGFRHLGKAPEIMIIPVLSDEANLSEELAKRLLEEWLATQQPLLEKISAKLQELGYAAVASPFDAAGKIGWQALKDEHAKLQYDGTFLEGEDKNAVMLASLLLGWFGSDKDEMASEEEVAA